LCLKDEWLTTYTNANPKRSMYMFCLNREKPGLFHLCFKAGQKAKLLDWSVRVIPGGFELMKQSYPTMRDLCNGFKLIFGNMQNAGAALGGRGAGGLGGGNYGGGYGARR
jgi:transcription elongation factor SPT6